MDKNNELLEKQIATEFEDLECTVSSVDKADAVDRITKLYELKLKADEQKATLAENAAKQKAERTDRVIKLVIFGVETVVPLAFGGYWMGRGFKFEETGAFCSSVFKAFTQKFFRGK